MGYDDTDVMQRLNDNPYEKNQKPKQVGTFLFLPLLWNLFSK